MTDHLAESLLDRHDALLVDLDGVVYLSDDPIAHAVASLQAARRTVGVRYVTNNASRTAADVAAALQGFGLDCSPDDVVTAALTAAAVLASQHPAGSPVLVVGGAGLVDAVRSQGLRAVSEAAEHPVAVVQGWASTVGWAQLAEACVAVRAGVPWLATNLDVTLPSPRGPLPGNGSMVAALSAATGVTPGSVGKPAPDSLRAAARSAGARRPLVVGDRLDTDIRGANAARYDSLLVLTGVSRPADVVCAPDGDRPTYLAADLRALADPPVQASRTADDVWRCRDATATVDGDSVSVAGDRGGDGLDRLRALALAVADRPDLHDEASHQLADGHVLPVSDQIGNTST